MNKSGHLASVSMVVSMVDLLLNLFKNVIFEVAAIDFFNFRGPQRTMTI